MADEKPLTIPALISAMKEAGFATRSDVEAIVDQRITARGLATQEHITQSVLDASEAILKGVDEIVGQSEQRLNNKFLKQRNA